MFCLLDVSDFPPIEGTSLCDEAHRRAEHTEVQILTHKARYVERVFKVSDEAMSSITVVVPLLYMRPPPEGLMRSSQTATVDSQRKS